MLWTMLHLLTFPIFPVWSIYLPDDFLRFGSGNNYMLIIAEITPDGAVQFQESILQPTFV